MKTFCCFVFVAILAVPTLASAIGLQEQYEAQLQTNYNGMAQPDVSLTEHLNVFLEGNPLSTPVNASDDSQCAIELAQYRSSGCSIGCSSGCSMGCSSGCSMGCSSGCSVGCR